MAPPARWPQMESPVKPANDGWEKRVASVVRQAHHGPVLVDPAKTGSCLERVEGRHTRRPPGYVRRMTTSTRSTTAPSGGSGRLDRVMSSSRTSFR